MGYTEWTFDKKYAIYIQLYQKIKYSILSGQLALGESIPSIRQMAATLHINISTVAKAYQLIKHDGLLVTTGDRKNSVTFDSAFVQEKRTQEAEKLCCNYICVMGLMGFSKEETLTFLQKYRKCE